MVRCLDQVWYSARWLHPQVPESISKPGAADEAKSELGRVDGAGVVGAGPRGVRTD